MTADALHGITWAAVGLSYLIGVINLVLLVRGRFRAADRICSSTFSGRSSSAPRTISQATASVEGGER